MKVIRIPVNLVGRSRSSFMVAGRSRVFPYFTSARVQVLSTLRDKM